MVLDFQPLMQRVVPGSMTAPTRFLPGGGNGPPLGWWVQDRLQSMRMAARVSAGVLPYEISMLAQAAGLGSFVTVAGHS